MFLTSTLCVCASACNVTIHNRCRDSLASCAKMKQRVRPVQLSVAHFLSVCLHFLSDHLSVLLQQQQKLAMVRNSSALQNVALRTKSESTCPSLFPPVSPNQLHCGKRRSQCFGSAHHPSTLEGTSNIVEHFFMWRRKKIRCHHGCSFISSSAFPQRR